MGLLICNFADRFAVGITATTFCRRQAAPSFETASVLRSMEDNFFREWPLGGLNGILFVFLLIARPRSGPSSQTGHSIGRRFELEATVYWRPSARTSVDGPRTSHTRPIQDRSVTT